jgi:hypothetical protein
MLVVQTRDSRNEEWMTYESEDEGLKHGDLMRHARELANSDITFVRVYDETQELTVAMWRDGTRIAA